MATELIKLLALNDNKAELFHFRTSDNKEVDFVIEQRNEEVIGIEVKAAEVLEPKDFNGLKELQKQIKENFVCGVVLYTGSHAVSFGDNLWVIPMQALF